jgi:MFS family permease
MKASYSLASVSPPLRSSWPPGLGRVTWRNAIARPNSWRVLRHGRFLGYFVGSLISNLGTWLQNTAQMLLAYQITHSVFAVGLITCAQFSGFLIFGPWVGTLADQMGRKRVLIAAQIFSALVAAALALLILKGVLREWELIVGALGSGIAFTFAIPAQNAMVPTLVPEEDTKAALAMNSVSYNGGRMLAPVLCLVVLASIGTGWAFALNAISFLVFALVIAFFDSSMTQQEKPARAWTGLRFAIRRPRIMLLLAMVAAVTIADDPVLVLGPSLAHQVLRASSVWPAYFLSALGLGTVLGALLPTRPSTARRAAIPLAMLAISVVVFALGISVWISFLAAVMAGLAGLLTGASAQALLLEQAGPRHATQVMALWAVAWAGTKPIASITDGWLASSVGVHWAAVVLAAPAFGVAFLEGCPGKWLDRYKRILKEKIYRYNERRGYVVSGQQHLPSAVGQPYAKDELCPSVIRTDRLSVAGPASSVPDAFWSGVN